MTTMDFKEALKYMQETGKPLHVVESAQKYGKDKYIRICMDGIFIHRLQWTARSPYRDSTTWVDFNFDDMQGLMDLVEMTYEPAIEYMPFIDAVKQIKGNNKLKFARKQDTDNNVDEFLMHVSEPDTIIQDIAKYNDTYGVWMCPKMEDILATDWYVADNHETLTTFL